MDFGGPGDDDLDFLSVGHAQSHSVSYPSIHFGNEDDPSRAGSEASSSPVISKHGFSKKAPTQPATAASTPKQTRTLYIQVRPCLAAVSSLSSSIADSVFPPRLQMEYVEKLTLRETIEDGLSEVDSWRLLVRPSSFDAPTSGS